MHTSNNLLIRTAEEVIRERMKHFPAVALLGPRQCGKSTLAKMILEPMADQAIYLDLERPSAVIDKPIFVKYATKIAAPTFRDPSDRRTL